MRLIASLCLVATCALVTTAEAQTRPAAPAARRAAAAAPASSLDSDARCLLGMAALSNATDQNSARAGQIGVIYFAGRVSARDPGFDFARLRTMASGMNAQTMQTELQQTCGPMLNTVMQKLQAALESPPKASAPGAPPPAPQH
jgi:hypothetical protein